MRDLQSESQTETVKATTEEATTEEATTADTSSANETIPTETAQTATSVRGPHLGVQEYWRSDSGNIEFYVPEENGIESWGSGEGTYTDPDNIKYDIIVESFGMPIWNEENDGHLYIYAYHYENEEFEDETTPQEVMVPEDILCGDFVFGETKDEIILTAQNLKENFIHTEYSDGDVVRFYHVK